MNQKSSHPVYLMLLYVLPKSFISRLVGIFAETRLPMFIKGPLFRWYIKTYQVNVEESEKDVFSYPTLNQFFTRNLKPGRRPIDETPGVITSPVDGKVSRFGDIIDGKMIQAKEIDYTLKGILDCERFQDDYKDGKYMVIYLSPPDYHKIHTPYECKVQGYSYSPGKLWPVNELAVTGIKGLFPRNERITSYMETPAGKKIALVKVGATNVGKMSVVYDDVITNRWIRSYSEKEYENPVELKRGQEIGRFNMGSTVVMIFEKDSMDFLEEIYDGMKIKLGTPIAKFK